MLTFRADPVQLAVNRVDAALTTQETTQEVRTGTVREKIVELLHQQPAATRYELARQLGLSSDGVKYHLNKLRVSGTIRHVGPTKSGYWEVLK